jgi:colanic acid/amylovoran biosynthesis glycosyltransferase
LPIIAFDSGGVKYTFKNHESGFLCNVYDVDEMYKKVCFFYNNREQALKLSLEGRKFVEENFSENIIKNKWRKIYQ